MPETSSLSNIHADVRWRWPSRERAGLDRQTGIRRSGGRELSFKPLGQILLNGLRLVAFEGGEEHTDNRLDQTLVAAKESP